MQYTKEQMVIEDSTYQVPPRWYKAVWIFLTACNLWFVAAFSVTEYVFPQLNIGKLLGVDLNTFILATISLVYLIPSFWIFFRRNASLSSFIGTMLTVFVIYIAASSSKELSIATIVYCLLWGVTIWLLGIYGSTISIGIALVGVMSQLVAHNFIVTDMPPITLIFAAVTVTAGIINYIFWNRRLEVTHDKELDKLSGMLQSNRQQSEILIHSITDGIIVTDITGKITLMNPAAAAMTQWTVGEAAGIDARLVLQLTHEDGSEISPDADPFALVFAQQKHTSQVLVLEGREGKNIVISLSVSPILIPDEAAPRGAVAVIRDISEDRAAEKQRGEFISTASHEMRTPVAAIEGYLALALNDKVSTIDSRARGFLEKAHSSTTHLGKLFQDLLTSSKAEDGRLSSHPVIVEMGAYLQQLSDDLRFSAEKKGLSVDFVIGGADETIDATTKDASVQHLVKPLYYVNADPDRMREVITNLFDNACKYTDAGKVSLGLTGDNDVVQIYIRDTGAGIPVDDIPHLFQKFYRVDNSATRTIGGTGLGLFISRKIVELYQGRIWVESEVGVGSTFFINLPRVTAQHAADMQAAEAAKAATAAVPKA
jgi:PAS domain S-box-containing protein